MTKRFQPTEPFPPGTRTKAEVLATMRRVGAPEEARQEVEAQFGEHIDPNDLFSLLLRHGITIDWAISKIGGSP
jgi:hypothetical protein